MNIFLRIIFIILCFQMVNGSLCFAIPKEDLLIHEINLKVATSFKSKYGLEFIGVRLGDPNKIEPTGFIFEFIGTLSKAECRKLIVNCAEECIAAINANQEIQQYLCTSPFKIKNICITIYFLKPNLDAVRYPNISIVKVRNGKVDYVSIDVKPNKYGKYKIEEEEEPYEEAFRIVHEEARK